MRYFLLMSATVIVFKACAVEGDIWSSGLNSGASDSICISSGGTVATRNSATADSWGPGVRGVEQMSDGVHYWEVTMIDDVDGRSQPMVGVSKPGLDLDTSQYKTDNAWLLWLRWGSLYGNGNMNANQQGFQPFNAQSREFLLGDTIGMLLDLNAGSLTFYRNGVEYGIGHPSGVTGPVVRFVEMSSAGTAVSLNTAATGPTTVTGMCTGNTARSENVDCSNGDGTTAANTQNKGSAETGTDVATCCEAVTATVTGMCMGNTACLEDVDCSNGDGTYTSNTRNKGSAETGTDVATCCEAWGDWNVEKVTSMDNMFDSNAAFNGAIAS